EGGPASVLAGSLYALSESVPGALLVTVAFALLWEWVGGETMRVMRQINVRVVAGPDGSRRAEHIQLRHFAAILLDIFRGILLVGVGMLCLSALLAVSANYWGVAPEVARLATGAVAVGLFAATFGIFPGRVRLFLSGVAAGLLFVLLRG